MSPPKYEPAPIDPNLQAQAAQAERDKVTALTDTVRGDTAKILQRYGSAVALSGAAIPSPISSAVG